MGPEKALRDTGRPVLHLTRPGPPSMSTRFCGVDFTWNALRSFVRAIDPWLHTDPARFFSKFVARTRGIFQSTNVDPAKRRLWVADVIFDIGWAGLRDRSEIEHRLRVLSRSRWRYNTLIDTRPRKTDRVPQ